MYDFTVECEQVAMTILQCDAFRLGVSFNPDSGICTAELLNLSAAPRDGAIRLWCLQPNSDRRIPICELCGADRAEVLISSDTKAALATGLLAMSCDHHDGVAERGSAENYLATGTISVGTH